MPLHAVLLACAVVASSAAAVYDPPDAGVSLDVVEKALGALVKNPHLTATQMAQAQKVVDDVEKTAAELGSAAGKKLSKEARAAKVFASIKELKDLQADWSKASTQMVASHKAKLMEEMKAKEDELAKDQKMLKVLNLQKALAEKKLSLQKLIEKKNDQAAEKVTQEEAKKKEEMVAKMLEVAKSMQAKTKPADDKVQPVMAYLRGRAKDVNASLAKMEDANTKQEAEMSKMASQKLPVLDQKDPLVKAQSVIKMFMKKQQRQFQKSKLPLENEGKELQHAISAINKGDAAELLKVGTKMQGEMKTLQAKSHKVLY